MSLKLQQDQYDNVNTTVVSVRDRKPGPARTHADDTRDAENSTTDEGQLGLPTARQPMVSDTIDYILDFTTQLRAMAQQAGLVRLGLILLLAEQEAQQQGKRHPKR